MCPRVSPRGAHLTPRVYSCAYIQPPARLYLYSPTTVFLLARTRTERVTSERALVLERSDVFHDEFSCGGGVRFPGRALAYPLLLAYEGAQTPLFMHLRLFRR